MKIQLPQLTVELSSSNFNSALPLLFTAGGRPPRPEWLRQTAAHGAVVWAIDKGINSCHAADIIPQRLTGDADSAAAGSWQWAQDQNVPIDRFPPAKDLTDFQLALELSRQEFPNHFIIVTGAFGGRTDHFLSLLWTVAGDNRHSCLADDKETLFLLRSGDFADFIINNTARDRLVAVSLLPVTAECRGVSIDGVRWPLKNAAIRQRLPYAVSNELSPEAKKISVGITDGILGVYFAWGDITA